MVSPIPFDANNFCLNQLKVIDVPPQYKRKSPEITTQKKATSRLAFGGKIRMATFYLHNQYLPVTQNHFKMLYHSYSSNVTFTYWFLCVQNDQVLNLFTRKSFSQDNLNGPVVVHSNYSVHRYEKLAQYSVTPVVK